MASDLALRAQACMAWLLRNQAVFPELEAAYPGVEGLLRQLAQLLPHSALQRLSPEPAHRVGAYVDGPGKGVNAICRELLKQCRGNKTAHMMPTATQVASADAREDPALHMFRSFGVGSLLPVKNDAKLDETWQLLITSVESDHSSGFFAASGVWAYNQEDMKKLGWPGQLGENELVLSNERYRLDLRSVSGPPAALYPSLLENKNPDDFFFQYVLDVEAKPNVGVLHKVTYPSAAELTCPERESLAETMLTLQFFAMPACGWVRCLRL